MNRHSESCLKRFFTGVDVAVDRQSIETDTDAANLPDQNQLFSLLEFGSLGHGRLRFESNQNISGVEIIRGANFSSPKKRPDKNRQDG